MRSQPFPSLVTRRKLVTGPRPYETTLLPAPTSQDTPHSYAYIYIIGLSFQVYSIIQVMKMNDTSCFTLTTCLFIHFFIVTTNNWVYHVLASREIILSIAMQGVMFLMYPLFGLIADICVTQTVSTK